MGTGNTAEAAGDTALVTQVETRSTGTLADDEMSRPATRRRGNGGAGAQPAGLTI